MINTNPARFRSGTIWFEIDVNNASNDGNVELYDISPLSFEFDLKSSESAINSLGVMPGSMSVTVSDTKPDGKSVYEALAGRLSSFLAPFIPTTSANVYFLKHGETTPNVFPFQVQFTGVKTDLKNDLTTITLLPPTQSQENVRSFYPNIPEPQIVFRVQNTNYNAQAMGDVIYRYVGGFNMAVGNSTVYDTGTDPAIGGSNGFVRQNDLNTLAFDDQVVYAFVNTNIINSARQDDPILSKVVSAAAMEGAFFGSAFSVNFYVNRRRTDKNVTLSNSDITELSYAELDRQVNGINVFINTQSYPSGFQALPTSPKPSFEVAGYPLGTQFVGLDLQAHAPQFNRGNWSAISNTSTTRVVNADAVSLDLTTGFLVTAGSTAYSQAFSAYQVQGAPVKVQTKVLGVDTVMPYETIKFDSTVAPRFRDKHFRPSSMKYDFKDDSISITAYEIFP